MSIGTPTGERCPRCNTPGVLMAGDGSCPGCLLELALAEPLDDIPQEDYFTGDTCGNYQLGGILGRGGHGIVFLARRADSPKTYALKMLASAKLAGPDELRRFRLEAESAMALEHPNIVRVVDVGEQNGIPFFVMEHAPGGSLADQQQASDTPETLRNLIRNHVSTLILVARAVHFAHERGVLHRDLKPANILLNEIGEPLVSDFGLARLLHAPSGVTMTGATLGTPAYMAPEQAAGSTLTIAADVYSLGAVLFHLLTGRPPFAGETPLETLRLVTNTDAPDPRKLAPWIDRDLAMICLTALRRELPRRYANAANLADDLERWSRGEPVAARPLNGLEKLVKACRRHPIKATLALSMSVALASLAAVYVTGSILLREERNRAVLQGAIAKVNAAEATRARDESRLHAYAADMHIAFRAFDDGHLGQARRMLARQSPAAGLPDLRGFEWHALSRRCEGDDMQSWNDHQGAVMATAFSPDGKLLASGGRDGRLIVRKVPDGDIILSLPKVNSPRGMAEIPLMTTVAGNSVELRKILLEGKLNPDEVRMRGRPSKLGEIATVAWSPDGTQFATAGLGSYVRIWKYPTGELCGIIPVITAVNLCFLPDDGGIAVFLDSDVTPKQYELRIYHQDLSLAARVQGLQEAHAFSSDGRRIATLEMDRTRITLRAAATGAARSTLEPLIQLKRLAFSHDASLLWGVEKNGTLAACWRIRDGVRLGQIFPVSGKLDLLATFPDGERLAATGAGQALTVQHAKGAAAATMMSGHEDIIRSLTVSSDGSWIATGGNDHSTRLWKGSTTETKPADDPNPLTPTASHPAVPPGHLIAVSDHGIWTSDGKPGGNMRFVDPEGKELRKVRAPPGPYERLISSADGQAVGAFSWPRWFRLLDQDGMDWSDAWKLSPGTVGPIVFSSDGQWLASGGDDNMITVRNVPEGTVIAVLKGHQRGLVDLAFTPDGRSLASTADDGTLRLWHTATWRDLGILHHGELLRKIRFSSDGSRLSAETDDGALREFGRREE